MEKTERFGLVLSPREKTAVERLAELEGGLSKAALMRRLIRREAHERGLWPQTIEAAYRGQNSHADSQ